MRKEEEQEQEQEEEEALVSFQTRTVYFFLDFQIKIISL
jgi:hypothetical protein